MSIVGGLYARFRSLCCASRVPTPATSTFVATANAREMSEAAAETELPDDSLQVETDAQPRTETSTAAMTRAKTVREWLEANDLLGHGVEDGAACGVALVYDETMLLHCGPPGHPERPTRVKEILAQLRLSGLIRACAQLPSREVSEEELCLCHDSEFVHRVLNYEAMARRKAKAYTFPFGPDTYVCEHTARCARLSAGSPLNLLDAAFDKSSPVTCGMAVIRPPGHHATADRASGFCLFNNVAVAARYAQDRHKVKRVAIVDWDVHHGNGTNDLFAEDPDVLFFSMHRYDHGFFPGSGFLEDAGKSNARGYTVNVPLGKGFGDIDVSHVMRYILCPLLEKFNPEVIFISAGFDAVKGDPLGDCRISPECYGWMTRCLYRLAKHYCEGRLFLLLEGGYNPDMIAQCTVECVEALVAETTGLSIGTAELSFEAAPSVTTTPAASRLGTPVMSPAHSYTASDIPTMTLSSIPSAELTPSSPRQSEGTRTPTSCPASPSMKPQKARIPSTKTLVAVRKVSELHHILPLELPLAPKPSEGAGKVDKNAKKNQKRRMARKSSDGAEEDTGASSDSSAWAIALGGLSDPDLPSAVPSPSPSLARHTAAPPSFQLPPAFPGLGEGVAARESCTDEDQGAQDSATAEEQTSLVSPRAPSSSPPQPSSPVASVGEPSPKSGPTAPGSRSGRKSKNKKR